MEVHRDFLLGRPIVGRPIVAIHIFEEFHSRGLELAGKGKESIVMAARIHAVRVASRVLFPFIIKIAGSSGLAH